MVIGASSWRGLQQVRATPREGKSSSLNLFDDNLPAIFLQCEFDHDSTVTCLDLDSASMRVVSGTKDGKPLFSLSSFAPVRYVLITYSGFVTVWSIDNESRDYELQGKHVNHLYINLILYYHSSLCSFL